MQDLKLISILPEPEHHPFFTDPEPVEEEHWLVRVFEWTVSKWLGITNRI
jgi:hypothetical protein